MGRGGPLRPVEGGVYTINDVMLRAYGSAHYANHASNLGALLAHRIAEQFEIPAYIVDPVTTDEFNPVARISGVPGIERKCRSHALNIKFCARKTAQDLELSIESTRFIVAHLGSGFSIAALESGRIIDVNDALLGMGPFSVERAGALPLSGMIELCYDKKIPKRDLQQLLSKKSGLKGYLGTNNFQEIENRIRAEDREAKSITDAMIYQIVKEIGGCYAILGGESNALILTGGLLQSEYLRSALTRNLAFISPHYVYPGSFELEALADGALRVLAGKLEPKEYTES